MTEEEYRKCKWAAKMYQKKVRECESLKRQLAQREREIKILKERLRYKTASDVQYSKDDADVFGILKTRGRE